jgi:hypothetical protein
MFHLLSDSSPKIFQKPQNLTRTGASRTLARNRLNPIRMVVSLGSKVNGHDVKTHETSDCTKNIFSDALFRGWSKACGVGRQASAGVYDRSTRS